MEIPYDLYCFSNDHKKKKKKRYSDVYKKKKNHEIMKLGICRYSVEQESPNGCSVLHTTGW